MCISARRGPRTVRLGWDAWRPLAAVPPLPGRFPARAVQLFGCGPKETCLGLCAAIWKTSSLDLEKPNDLPKPMRITTPHPFPNFLLNQRTSLSVAGGVLPKQFFESQNTSWNCKSYHFEDFSLSRLILEQTFPLKFPLSRLQLQIRTPILLVGKTN